MPAVSIRRLYRPKCRKKNDRHLNQKEEIEPFPPEKKRKKLFARIAPLFSLK
jgi:hypothetical protein